MPLDLSLRERVNNDRRIRLEVRSDPLPPRSDRSGRACVAFTGGHRTPPAGMTPGQSHKWAHEKVREIRAKRFGADGFVELMRRLVMGGGE